jgi:hypothetical protein
MCQTHHNESLLSLVGKSKITNWSVIGLLTIAKPTHPIMSKFLFNVLWLSDCFNTCPIWLLVDFFSPIDIADQVDEVLMQGDRLANFRASADETILKHYNLANLLPQQMQWLLGQPESSKLSRGKGFAAKSRINQPALNLKHPTVAEVHHTISRGRNSGCRSETPGWGYSPHTPLVLFPNHIYE